MKAQSTEKKARFRKIKLLLLYGIAAYCLYQMGSYAFQSYANHRLTNQLQALYSDADAHDSGINENNEAPQHSEVAHPPGKNEQSGDNAPKEDNMPLFEELLAMNPQVVGWISIEDTKIDYPVVQGEDNEYYLQHNVKQEPSIAGTIFMDYRNEGNDQDLNTIIYGHHMKDGSMFTALTGYKQEDFLKAHPKIQFTTLKDTTQWEIFSVYITDTDFDYIKTNFNSPEEYTEFLRKLKSKSLYDIPVAVTGEDRILTLSTCTYEFKNARFAVHAKLIPSK